MELLFLFIYLLLGLVSVVAGTGLSLLALVMPRVAAKRSNCALYAFTRLYYEGGHVILTRSNHGFWPHFRWIRSFAPDEEIWEFTPAPWIRKRGRWLPPIIFTGTAQQCALPIKGYSIKG